LEPKEQKEPSAAPEPQGEKPAAEKLEEKKPEEEKPIGSTAPRKRELVGWLVMPRREESGTVIIEVQKEGRAIYLGRPDGEPRSLLISAGRSLPWRDEPAETWTKEAAKLWQDLTLEGAKFRPRYQGYPKEERLKRLFGSGKPDS
jgi:hypothetical protein